MSIVTPNRDILLPIVLYPSFFALVASYLFFQSYTTGLLLSFLLIDVRIITLPNSNSKIYSKVSPKTLKLWALFLR